MKRFLILLSILLSVFSIYSKTISISPYGGFTNINMASTDYRATEGLQKSEFPEWTDDPNADLSEGKLYSDAQMIGTGAIEDMSVGTNQTNFIEGYKEGNYNSSTYNPDAELYFIDSVKMIDLTRFCTGKVHLNQPITITVTGAEGYNFVSQSNSEYKRPFELVLIGKYSTDIRKTDSDFMFIFDQDNQSHIINDEEFQEMIKDDENFIWNDRRYHADGSPQTHDHFPGDKFDQKLNIWFDLVLVLPGEVSSTGNLEIDGRNYPLKEADDYLAVITYTITQGNESQSVSIPFSGYYSSINDNPEPNYVSLSVAPTGNAANLNMNTDSGRLVKVADVDFMMDVTPTYNDNNKISSENISSTENIESLLKSEGKNTNVKIFFSANNAPGAPYEEGFKLVHSSVISGATLTNYNSAPFTVVTEAKSGRTLYKRLSANEYVDGAQDGSESSISFTGDEWADKSGDIHSDNSHASCIYPDLYVSYPRKVYIQDKNPQVYYAWEGEIYVLIDPNVDTRMMLDGRYTSSIYVHVIAD